MVKRVRRIVSGQCAIARICGESADEVPVHTGAMTAALWDEWQKSSRLKPSFDTYASRADLPVDLAVETICSVKKLDNEKCVANLRRCLEDIGNLNKLKQSVHTRAAEGFSKENESHEQGLELLWQTLLPGEKREGGRFSREWNRIGFQQSDPASDFRGAGVLALDQLLHIAKTRTSIARRMLTEPPLEMSRYPWACAGINLTRECLRVLDNHMLDKRLYGLDSERALTLIHDVYADMFEILHHAWVEKNPENVLAFPDVFKKVMTNVDRQLGSTGVLVPPGASAS